MRLQEQLKVLLKKETFNLFLTYACFYCLYHVSSTLTYVFRNHMSKLRKNKTNYLFYFKTFFIYQSEKIDLLKAIDAAKFEEGNKVKLYILQIIFQKNV